MWLLIAIILSTLLPPLDAKRGGILGGSRSRGSSASRAGGGLFGGGSKPMRTSSGANAYHRNLGGGKLLITLISWADARGGEGGWQVGKLPFLIMGWQIFQID